MRLIHVRNLGLLGISATAVVSLWLVSMEDIATELPWMLHALAFVALAAGFATQRRPRWGLLPALASLGLALFCIKSPTFSHDLCHAMSVGVWYAALPTALAWIAAATGAVELMCPRAAPPNLPAARARYWLPK